MKEKKRKRQEIDIIQGHLEEQAILEELLDEDSYEKPRRKKINPNKEYVHVTYLFVVLFLAMMGYIIYFTAVKSKDLINSPYNVRLNSMAERVVRGDIVDNEGNILATTEVSDDGAERRVYPYGKLYAHVVGYDVNGKAGLELSENFDLLTSSAFFIERIINQMKDEKNIGNTIVTTLDTDLQKAAYDALGNHDGAVVVMDITTGKILTMVSKPSYTPGTVSKNWDKLVSHKESVLLNRATQGAYAPGSTFKIVTTLEFMRENADFSSYRYKCNGKIELEEDDTVIHCAGMTKHGKENLEESLAYSCNTSYANMALSLNRSSYKKTAEDLLFNKELPNVLAENECKKSVFAVNNKTIDSELMMTAIGQGETMVSPYHMTLIAAAIANGGVLMKPYVVSEVRNYKGVSIEKTRPMRYKKLMSSVEAAQLKTYMESVVLYGTGKSLAGKEYEVAGKTGTAEYSTTDKSKVHSWFMGFTNPDNPELAIAVVIEGADQSGARAISVAEKVFEAYY